MCANALKGAERDASLMIRDQLEPHPEPDRLATRFDKSPKYYPMD